MDMNVRGSTFKMARKWKQPKCPATDKGFLKPAVYPHNGILFNHEKEAGTDRVTARMSLANSRLSERSQTQIATHSVYESIQRKVQNRPDHRDREYVSGCQGRGE